MQSKTICLVFALALAALLPVQAQWRVGASAGGDHNWYAINTNYQTDYHYDGAWGWNAAVFTQYNFMPWLGLRAEVEASERNYRFYRTGAYSATDYITHNTYLQLPVMAQFSFGDAVGTRGASLRGFMNIGVYAGCLLAGRQKGTQLSPLDGKAYPIDADYVFNKEKDQRADFGLAGGIGIEYQFLEHWACHVEGRAYYSFVSTVKPYMQIKDNRYNTTIGIQAGFSYIF